MTKSLEDAHKFLCELEKVPHQAAWARDCIEEMVSVSVYLNRYIEHSVEDMVSLHCRPYLSGRECCLVQSVLKRALERSHVRFLFDGDWGRFFAGIARSKNRILRAMKSKMQGGPFPRLGSPQESCPQHRPQYGRIVKDRARSHLRFEQFLKRVALWVLKYPEHASSSRYWKMAIKTMMRPRHLPRSQFLSKEQLARLKEIHCSYLTPREAREAYKRS